MMGLNFKFVPLKHQLLFANVCVFVCAFRPRFLPALLALLSVPPNARPHNLRGVGARLD